MNDGNLQGFTVIAGDVSHERLEGRARGRIDDDDECAGARSRRHRVPGRRRFPSPCVADRHVAPLPANAESFGASR